MLETSLYIIFLIYTINCPHKFIKTCLRKIMKFKNLFIKKWLSLSEKRIHPVGKISNNWYKNNQQGTYIAHNFAFKHTTYSKAYYSTSTHNAITPHHPSKPKLTDEDLGYYLAGLIEGDGHFSKRLEIVFHENDIAFIHILRSKIGFGSIYKVKDKRAYKLSIGSREGFTRIWELVNGKFVADHKVIQFNKNPYGLILEPGNKTVRLNNYWLSGFIAADGGLYLDITNSKTHLLKKSCRLTIRITQKDRTLLDLIKEGLTKDQIPSAKIQFRFDGKVHRLRITDRKVALNKIVKYLDKYPFICAKHIQYFYWRKAYLLMETKEHITPKGLETMKKYQSRMVNIYKDPQRLHA